MIEKQIVIKLPPRLAKGLMALEKQVYDFDVVLEKEIQALCERYGVLCEFP